MRLEINSLSSLGEIRPGDDLPRLIRDAAQSEGRTIARTTIVAVAQKIVSKSEGALVDLRRITPSALAQSWASEWGKDARVIEVILSQAHRIVRMDRGVLIAETHHGFVCAHAGVDQSNAGLADLVILLPKDPDASARRLRDALQCGAVIITDTFGRPWREGLVDVAIGVAGLDPLRDYRGSKDRSGRKLTGTVLAVGDQLAAAAGLVMGKADGSAVVLIEGFDWNPAESSVKSLIRKPEQDLFR